MSEFSVQMNDVLEMVDAVDPLRYARTRNFINGSRSDQHPVGIG